MDTNAMLALLDQNTDQLELALTTDPALLTALDQNRRSLLHWAALKGRQSHVEHLLAQLPQPAAIDAADDTGYTPLICASLRGDATIVRWLLAAGAAVNARNAQGHSALQYACSKGWSDCVELLLASDGCDVRVRDSRGDTVLHRLASLGRLELLRRMLAVLGSGADDAPASADQLLDVQNAEGDTALHVACQDGEAACALLLVEAGADVELLNREKKRAAELAEPALRRGIAERVEERRRRKGEAGK